MNRILSDKKSNIYKSKEILNDKYLYLKKTNNNYDYHYIFNISNIIENDNYIKYKTKKCYIFAIPFDNNSKCYLYEKNNEIEINQLKDVLYEMTFNEFVNTFRTFIKYDGMLKHEIPVKIIQDE